MIIPALLLLELPKADLPTVGPEAVVIWGIPEHHEVIGSEQDIHPDTTDLYLGEIYEIAFSSPRIVSNGVKRLSMTDRPIRIVAHAIAWKRPMIYVIDLSGKLPFVTWWDWADKRSCIPAEVVTRYRLSGAMKRGWLQRDGKFCIRP